MKPTNEEVEFAQAMIVKPTRGLNSSRSLRPDPLWRSSADKIRLLDQEPHIRHASSVSARITKTKLPSPKKAEEKEEETPTLEMVKQTKRQIDDTVALIKKICAHNEATPEIEVAFQPALELMKHQLPDFYKQATNYFVTLQRMQVKAKQNMILSSAMVKGALTEFIKCWQFFSDTLEKLYRIHPSPHAVRIEKSFKSIAHSLELILKANECRAHPSMNLKKAVWNIQELCNELIVNLVDMYSEPNFPHFDTDVLTLYKNDIRGFLNIINKAFRVEFQQCGLLRSDVMRIKSDVMVHVQEILNSLECAFLFPSEVAEAIKLKDTAEETLSKIFKQLSIPFFVVKPNPLLAQQIEQDQQGQLLTTPRDGSPMSERVAADEDVPDIDVNLRVKKFLATCERLLKQNFANERIDRSFETISTWIGETIVKTRELHQIIEKQKEQIEQISNTVRDKDTFYQTQSRTWSELTEQKEMDRKSLETQLKSTVQEIAALKSDLVWAQQDQKNCKAITNDVQQKLQDTYIVLMREAGETEGRYSSISDMLENINRMARQIKKTVKVETVIKDDEQSNAARKLLQETTHSSDESLVALSNILIDKVAKTEEEIAKLKSELQSSEEEKNAQKAKFDEEVMNLRANIADLKGKLALKKQESEKDTEEILVAQEKIMKSDSQGDILKNFARMDERIKEVESEMKKQEEKFVNDMEEVRLKLGENCGYDHNEVPDLNAIIDALGTNNTPMQQKYEVSVTRVEQIEDELRALYHRILGMKHLESAQSSEESFDGIVGAVYNIINSLQDERESILSQMNFAKETASKFRTCFASLEQKLRAYITADAPRESTDDALIEKVFDDVDAVLSPTFNENFMRTSDVRACFAVLNVDMSANPKEYVPAFCRVFEELEKSMETVKHFSKLLNTLPEGSDLGTSVGTQADNLDSLIEHTKILQKAMDAVPMLSTDETIYNVLSKFVWLSKALASHVSPTKNR